jgi:hypothetical protein
MDGSLNERIQILESQVINLSNKLTDLINTTKGIITPPYSIVGDNLSPGSMRPSDLRAGRGGFSGTGIVWHSGELDTPPATSEISLPDDLDSVQAYNRHSHSRISGGALDKNTLEIVELEFDGQNPHSSQFWQEEPRRKIILNTDEQPVESIGLLDLVFDPDKKMWGAAAHEIDVKKCYFVMRDEKGIIMKDENKVEMKSPLYNEDVTRTSVVWDKDAAVWRLYAVYAPGITPTP